MRKIMQKKKPLLLSMLAGLSVCLIGGCASTASAEVDIRDYFEIPSEIQTSAYVGAETQIARIRATDDLAGNFKFILLDESGNEVETDGYKFVPEKAGEYKCVYTYMLGEEKYEYSYALNVTVKDGPVFSDTLKLPYALMAERQYVLPTIEAKDYSVNTSGEPVEVTVTAKCSGESVAVTDNKYFTPVYEGIGSEAEITYTAISNGVTETIVEKVPVLNPFGEEATNNGKVDFTQIFSTSGFESVEVKADSLVYSTINDAEAKFANIAHQDGIDFSFGFGSNFQAEGITMKIESLEDPSVYVTVSFQKGKIEEGKGFVVLNGNVKKEYTYTANQQLRVQYHTAKKEIIGAGAVSLFAIEEDANGNAFSGFPGNDVRISFTLDNVYGDADLAFYKISNFTFTESIKTNPRDKVEPVLYFPEVPLEYMIGDLVTIENVKAYDVVNPNVTIKVTILLNKQPISDVNGTTLKNVDGSKSITFKASQRGTYQVIYTITDGSGNPNMNNLQRAIYVYDREKPQITVESDMPTSATVDKQVAFPVINATDAQSGSAVELQLIVKWSSGKMRQIAYSTNGKLEDVTYTFKKKDTCTIIIVATDESSNYTRSEYTLVVS